MDVIELRSGTADSGRHLRVGVSEVGHDDAGGEVDVLIAIDITQDNALARFERHRVEGHHGGVAAALVALHPLVEGARPGTG